MPRLGATALARSALIGLALAALAACAAAASPWNAPLGISNGTTMSVTLVVNGRVIETVPPGSGQPSISGLPSLPWAVELRSPTGRVLTSVEIHLGDAWMSALPDGHTESGSVGRRLDLSCGRLDLFYGMPMSGPARDPNASFAPGDCE